MQQNMESTHDPRLFSAIQVIALDVIVTGLLLVSMIAAGFSVLSAILLSWFGGALVTFGCLAATYQISAAAQRRTSDQTSDAIRAWDADLALDSDETALGSATGARRSTAARRTGDDLLEAWEEDAQLENLEASAVLGHEPGRERRHRNMLYEGQDRRTGSR